MTSCLKSDFVPAALILGYFDSLIQEEMDSLLEVTER